MTTTQDLTTMEPSEIDSILFPLWAKRYQQAMYLMQVQQNAGFRWEERVEEIRADLREIRDAIAPLDAEYNRRGGWTRYDFVPDGHLHHYHCHTLRPTTTRLLVAEASGKDEAWIVENFAYAACTYCFPEAPVEAREVYLKEIADARRAEREAAKAEKAAKAAEKNLIEPVVTSGRWAEKIVTVYAAKGWLKTYTEWTVQNGGHPSYLPEDAAKIKAALAMKSIDTAPLIAKWEKAALKEMGIS